MITEPLPDTSDTSMITQPLPSFPSSTATSPPTSAAIQMEQADVMSYYGNDNSHTSQAAPSTMPPAPASMISEPLPSYPSSSSAAIQMQQADVMSFYGDDNSRTSQAVPMTQLRNPVTGDLTHIQQPVHTFRPAPPPAPQPMPSNLRHFVDSAVLPDATSQPSISTSRVTPRRGQDAAVRSAMAASGVPLTGANQSGRFPADPSMNVALPDSVDYSAMRVPQMLTQFSRVAQASFKLKQSSAAKLTEPPHVNPVETQSAVAYDASGQPTLYMSTNNQSSANTLAQRLSDPAAMIRSVAERGTGEDQLVAMKLLYHREQQQRQLSQPNADRDGIQRADDLFNMFVDGNVDVVQGRSHAEQHLGDRIASTRNTTSADISGTKIPCAACSQRLNKRINRGDNECVCGRFYTTQADVSQFTALAQELNQGTMGVSTTADMPRSNSPVAMLESSSSSAAPQKTTKTTKTTKKKDGSRRRK